MHQHKVFCDRCAGEIGEKRPVLVLKVKPCAHAHGSLNYDEKAAKLCEATPNHHGERAWELCESCWSHVNIALTSGKAVAK